MKKRFTLLFVLVLAVITSLVGCSSSGEGKESGKTEITYYSFSATPNYEEQLAQMVDAFEEGKP